MGSLSFGLYSSIDYQQRATACGRFQKFSEAQKVVIEGPLCPQEPPLALLHCMGLKSTADIQIESKYDHAVEIVANKGRNLRVNAKWKIRHRSTLYLLTSMLAALINCSMTPSNASDSTDTSGDHPTYVLAKIKENQEYLITYVKFRSVRTEDEIVLRGQFYGHSIEGKTILRDELILTKVIPGEYYLAEIRPFYDNIYPSKFRKPNEVIVIAPSRINYIGDIKTNVNKTLTRRSHDVSYEYLYSNKTVLQAESRNREIFSSLDTVVCLPGEEPMLLDVSGMKDAVGDSAD